jgi:hypothetical protein
MFIGNDLPARDGASESLKGKLLELSLPFLRVNNEAIFRLTSTISSRVGFFLNGGRNCTRNCVDLNVSFLLL